LCDIMLPSSSSPSSHASAEPAGPFPSLVAIDIEEKLHAADAIEKKEQIALQWLSSVERELVRSGAAEKVMNVICDLCESWFVYRIV
jgi:hypothetical protein